MGSHVAVLLIALAVGLVSGPFIIPALRRLKFGQEIREEGPSWHNKKSGTPTMGGIIFILAVFVSCMVVYWHDFKIVMLLYLSLAFGIIGFIDDFIKVKMKRNLGLTEIQKLLMQIVASVIFVGVLYINDVLPTVLLIPFTHIQFQMGIWYLPFAVFIIIAGVNAVNLTDGIDGLATSVTVVVMLFFYAAGRALQNSIAGFSIAVAGGCLAFLWFNKHPAKVFMGDTGSLFLGGAVAGVAVISGTPLFLLIAGGVYVIETASVILQVASFKLTGKRLFKMSPIHHHFEMCGWSEWKIVGTFSAFSILLGAVAYIGIQSF